MSSLRRALFVASAPLLLLASFAKAGEGSVWLPAPGTGSISISQISQDAEMMWAGGNHVNVPFKGLEQSTTLISGNWGLSDELAADFNIGNSSVNPTHGRAIPVENDGRTDLEAGLTWRFRDEIISGGASMAIRAGLILAGSYDVGGRGPAEPDVRGNANLVGAGPTAIGEGANGFEASAIVGKTIADRFAVSASLGMRDRSGKVPTETEFNLDGHFFASDSLVLSGGYDIKKSDGDINIGPPPGPGAHGTYWEKFPFVSEEYRRVTVGGTLFLERVNVGLNWAKVLDGKNTPEFQAVGFTLTYNVGQ